MIISIASDHAGFCQKQPLAAYLREQGYDVLDRGPESEDRVDYPDYAALVACDIASGEADRGVLVCGTGIGMAVAANKMRGIRAANVVTPQHLPTPNHGWLRNPQTKQAHAQARGNLSRRYPCCAA